MKYAVRRFRSLELALTELKPFILNGAHLRAGKPFRSLGGMRSREALANWLLCVAVNAIDDRTLTFTSDPIGGDGIIVDAASGEGWPTEHVMAYPRPDDPPDVGHMILNAIERKRQLGAAYAAGKTLVVFTWGSGPAWRPNRVARSLPSPLLFANAWVVTLQRADREGYVYGVVNLDVTDGDAPAVLVHINPDFEGWQVTRLQ